MQVFLTKENGRISEQTFKVIVQVSDLGFVPPDPDTQLATLNDDYLITDAKFQDTSSVTLEFPPSQQKINFTFTLLQDDIPEGEEVFHATLIPGPTGEPQYIPNPTNVSIETLIYIEDDDSKLCFMRLLVTHLE